MPGNPIKVRIESFQSIEKLELEIDGFTCVTGATNIGKSAIVRAVSGSILNRPVGPHVRKGQKFCTVEVTSDRWGFKWEKGARAGRYWVPGSDTPVDGIGAGQTPVTEEIGFRSVKVGDKKIHPWYASQLFPLFLLDQTGPAVTDFISEISRLKVLQDAIVLNVRKKKRLLDRASLREEEVEELERKLASLADLEKLEKLGPQLQEQMESIREYEEALGQARRIKAGLESSAASIRVLRGAKDLPVAALPEKEMGRLSPMGRVWIGLQAAARAVIPLRGVRDVLVPDLGDAGTEALRSAAKFAVIPSLRESVERLDAWSLIPEPEEVPDGLPALSRACSLASSIAAARGAVELLERVPEVPGAAPPDVGALSDLPSLDELSSLRGEVGGLEREAASLDEQLREVDEEIASIPTCPACGRPTSAAHEHVRQQPGAAG